MNKAKKPVIIIGAGIGGLSTAIRLAAQGESVIILEKNAQVGGKMSQVSSQGYRWDTGPSVITMRHVFEDLFASAGRNLEDYLTLEPVDPLTRYFYPDNTVLDIYQDLAKTLEGIAAIAPNDLQGYKDYLRYAARIHDITGPVFIYDHPPTPRSFTKIPPHRWLLADPFRSMHGAIKHFVKSPKLQQLLGRFATYVGGSPYDAPATLNVIADVELSGGVWYPRGGIYRIAEALERLATELGVSIHKGQPVSKIAIQGGRVQGVHREDGSVIQAKAVIANVDVTTVYTHLLPQVSSVQKRLNRLQNYEPSCSGFILMLGVGKSHPELAHHNIFFSSDYQAEFDAIFNKSELADDPTIYLAITAKTDASHAPENCENWFILVNAPPANDGIDWNAAGPAYRNRILSKLAEHGLDVRSSIVVEHMLTPIDLQRMSGAWRGALYGPSPNSRWAAFRRPHNRSKDFKGLYFAGGTTHPGGGVPMVMLSGKVAAEMYLQDFGKG